MANASTQTTMKRGRRSAGSANKQSSTATAVGSAGAGISDTGREASGDSTDLQPRDRIVVKHSSHSIGTFWKMTAGGALVEYVCDCHKQFRQAKRDAVTRLRPKAA